MKNLLLTQENLNKFRKGEKTATRKLYPLKEINACPDDWVSPIELSCEPGLWTIRNRRTGAVATIKPKYQAGEVTFIGEACCLECFKKDGIEDACYKTDDDTNEPNKVNCSRIKWRSKMFMPAWSARTFARINSVGCGRLWDMTEEDCIAEGIDTGSIAPPTMCFATLWDKINPKQKWASNPWTLIYGIERVEL